MHLSHSAGPRDAPLIETTIGDQLARIADRFADRDALVVRDQSYRATYRELWEEVGRAARALLARGVHKGTASGSGRPTATSGPSSSTRPRGSGRSSSRSTRPRSS